jgi:hypothetical protein
MFAERVGEHYCHSISDDDELLEPRDLHRSLEGGVVFAAMKHDLSKLWARLEDAHDGVVVCTLGGEVYKLDVRGGYRRAYRPRETRMRLPKQSRVVASRATSGSVRAASIITARKRSREKHSREKLKCFECSSPLLRPAPLV